MRKFFMTTDRLGFSLWEEQDLPLARRLWGDPMVGKYICADGVFSESEIEARLQKEINNQQCYQVAYWPIFRRSDVAFIGCCGLRPLEIAAGKWELGEHLLPFSWRQGYALEAAKAAIDYAFRDLDASSVCAGHHPDNPASPGLLFKLDFTEIEPQYYPPTGRMHPSYILNRP